jgi:hypothetical protein
MGRGDQAVTHSSWARPRCIPRCIPRRVACIHPCCVRPRHVRPRRVRPCHVRPCRVRPCCVYPPCIRSPVYPCRVHPAFIQPPCRYPPCVFLLVASVVVSVSVTSASVASFLVGPGGWACGWVVRAGTRPAAERADALAAGWTGDGRASGGARGWCALRSSQLRRQQSKAFVPRASELAGVLTARRTGERTSVLVVGPAVHGLLLSWQLGWRRSSQLSGRVSWSCDPHG